MQGEIKPTLGRVILLSLSLIFSLFLLMVGLSILIQITMGPGKFTFGNEFFIQCVVFTLVVAEAVLLTRYFEFSIPDTNALFSLKPARLAEILLGVVAAIGLTFLLSEADNFLQTFFPPNELERQVMIAAYHPGSQVERVFVVLSLVAAAPVGEELLFRGVMMNWLRDSGKWWIALAFTSVFFGISHVSIPRTIILIIPVGLLLGWIVLRTGSIFTSIAAHAAFNGFPLIAYWSGLKIRGYNTITEGPAHLPAIVWIGGSVAVVVCLYLLEIIVTKGKAEGND